MGGPVQTERGLCCTSQWARANEPVCASTMTIPGGLEMTTSRDVLEAMSGGQWARGVRVAGLRLPGGQLESEISKQLAHRRGQPRADFSMCPSSAATTQPWRCWACRPG